MAKLTISYQFGWFDEAYNLTREGFHPGQADPVNNGVSVVLNFTNYTGKVIKYLLFTFIPYDAVGEPVYRTQNEVRGDSSMYTGPLYNNASKNGAIIHNLWYNGRVKSIKLGAVNIEYMDGTKETIITKKYYDMFFKQILGNGSDDNSAIDAVMRANNTIVDLDGTMLSESVLSVFPSSQPRAASSGGCYVATSVYGSYDCPQVWVLRRYRDFTLAENPIGRLFIRIYYKVSPTLVKWFGNRKWFSGVFKPILDKKVRKLQDKGFSSSAYEDRNW